MQPARGLMCLAARPGVSVEDRGFLFADGIYEVCEIRGGGLVDEKRHLDRYESSLASLQLARPMSLRSLQLVLRETIRRNQVRDGILYFQVTRGASRRDHAFPKRDVPATLVVFVTSIDVAAREKKAETGVTVITRPDQRWARRDIKTVSLLPNVLAKQTARDAGAYEAWLVDDAGAVTEGASTNAWIVSRNGTIVTRPLSHDILPGISRSIILDAARGLQMKVEERAFTVQEAKAAPEAFLSSSSAILLPVVGIDGTMIGEGKPGPVTLRLRAFSRGISQVSGAHLPSI
ncbi:MAG: D-amino-acid transaminase [Candidatus Phaeomarinobacter sp.]